MNILVTGASGQLGSTLKAIAHSAPDLNFFFKSSKELDITDYQAIQTELLTYDYAYCINCAAYTHVDNAESATELAKRINVTGARNLALNCQAQKTVLIHISTDFVFFVNLSEPYREEAIARAIGCYGDTKYKGEQAIINTLKEYFIIRTSWLYSEFGHNFMKTMIRLGAERDELKVVNDQVSTPTYAKDLAEVILHIIKAQSVDYGLYHYSNEGVASWYDFAKAIFDEKGMAVNLFAVPSKAYPTAAQRPKYTVLDKSKIKSTFGIAIPHWKDSLKVALAAYDELST